MKTQYYTATSVDGYIADESNSLDWLFEVDRCETGKDAFDTFFAGVGAMAMGATTYEWVVEHERLLEDRRSGAATTETRRAGSSRIEIYRRWPGRTSSSSAVT